MTTTSEQPSRERDPNERKTLEDALNIATALVDRAAEGDLVDSEQYTLAAGFLVLCGDMAAMLDAAKKATHFCGWCERANGNSRTGLQTYSLDEVREHTVRCEHNPLVYDRSALTVALDRALELAGTPERNQDEQWYERHKALCSLCSDYERACAPESLDAARERNAL